MKPDLKLASDLARQFKAITEAQAFKSYPWASIHAFRRCLRDYERDGLWAKTTAIARERNVETCLAIVRPGDDMPRPNAIAYRAQSLWGDLQPVVVLTATAKLRALYGGECHSLISANLSHEIALTDLFLSKRQSNPEFAWTLINSKPGNGSLPDAVAGDVAFELVGRYNGQTIGAKLSLSATYTLELW